MMMLLYILLAIAYIPSITLLIFFLLISGINLYITIEFFRNIITNS